MTQIIINTVQISPCICSKARHALRISHREITNTKRCSPEYWNNVVEYFGREYNLNRNIIENALAAYEHYMLIGSN